MEVFLVEVLELNRRVEPANGIALIRAGMILVKALKSPDKVCCLFAACWNSRVQHECVNRGDRLVLDGRAHPVTGILRGSPIIHRNRTVSIARVLTQPADQAAEH